MLEGRKKATGVIYNSIGNSRTHLKINRKRNGIGILLSHMHLILIKEYLILLKMDLFLVLDQMRIRRGSIIQSPYLLEELVISNFSNFEQTE